MYDFTYQRADSVDDAAAKVKGADDAMLMAGGMTLIPNASPNRPTLSICLEFPGSQAYPSKAIRL